MKFVTCWLVQPLQKTKSTADYGSECTARKEQNARLQSNWLLCEYKPQSPFPPANSWFSRSLSPTSCINIIWELVRDTHSQAPPKTNRIRNSGDEVQESVFIHLKGYLKAHKSLVSTAWNITTLSGKSSLWNLIGITVKSYRGLSMSKALFMTYYLYLLI